MGKRRLDLLSLVSYFLLIFVVVIVLLHFVFGFQYVVILTDSMKPSINPNDLVVTAPVSPDSLRVGDVIMYRVALGNSTYQIVHRIIDIRTDPTGGYCFLTKGDNRKYTDPWRVYPDQVVGKVVLVVPGVGVVWYYAPLIVLAILLFIIASLAYDIAMILLEEEPVRPKSMKADLLAVRRKKIKVYHHRR
jgi:signal peptidase